MKSPAQPLVFCFADASRLCAAVQELYHLNPSLSAGLVLSAGKYYLCVQASLSERPGVRKVDPVHCLGAAPVLYAYRREHGLELSNNAVFELGRPLAN